MNKKIFFIVIFAYLALFIGSILLFNKKEIDYENNISLYAKRVDEQQKEIMNYKKLLLDNNTEFNLSDEKMMLSNQFYENLNQLKTIVDYAINKYCDQTQTVNRYQYNIIDSMLHEQTSILDDVDYRFDLAKVVYPELTGRKYLYRVKGIENDLLIHIDTYRMKIFIYLDRRDGGLTVIEKYRQDKEAYNNNFELEDYVISDWDDPFIGEYWSFAAEEYNNLIVPQNMEASQELYGRVIYALKRYCEENQIDEIFTFDVNKDIVSYVTNMAFTVKVESDNRILYMDLDCRRNKFHIYEVED